MTHSEALRAQLRSRAEAWAKESDRPSYCSLGKPGTVLFKPTQDNRGHGNFHDSSWKAIQATTGWAARLQKRHSQIRALPVAERASARELDSSNSSDALLMNCFCFPGAIGMILEGLGLEVGSHRGQPEFGFLPQLRLQDGTKDTTEIDCRYGPLLFEAKLTEVDFTNRDKKRVFRYSSLMSAFDVDALPGDDKNFQGYQLIRNVLAAYEHGASSVVLIDERRPDLREQWSAVHRAIALDGLSRRCRLITWQALASAAPPELAKFLNLKYGI